MKAISVKLVEYSPMTYGDYCQKHNKDFDNTMTDPGYEITYDTGYQSWCPKDVFDKAYLPITDEKVISTEDVDNFISDSTGKRLGNRSNTVSMLLKNGFEVSNVSSHLNEDLDNQNIAYMKANAVNKEDIRKHLSFVYAWAINGLGNPKYDNKAE